MLIQLVCHGPYHVSTVKPQRSSWLDSSTREYQPHLGRMSQLLANLWAGCFGHQCLMFVECVAHVDMQKHNIESLCGHMMYEPVCIFGLQLHMVDSRHAMASISGVLIAVVVLQGLPYKSVQVCYVGLCQPAARMMGVSQRIGTQDHWGASKRDHFWAD